MPSKLRGNADIAIAEWLRIVRKRLGLNQTEMGRRFGVSDRTLSRYENGRVEPPTSFVLTVAEETGIEIDLGKFRRGDR